MTKRLTKFVDFDGLAMTLGRTMAGINKNTAAIHILEIMCGMYNPVAKHKIIRQIPKKYMHPTNIPVFLFIDKGCDVMADPGLAPSSTDNNSNDSNDSISSFIS